MGVGDEVGVLTAVDVHGRERLGALQLRSAESPEATLAPRDLVERHSLEGARALRHRQEVAPVQPIQDAPLTFHRQILERDARVRHRPPRPPRGTHCSCEEKTTSRNVKPCLVRPVVPRNMARGA